LDHDPIAEEHEDRGTAVVTLEDGVVVVTVF
jgi:hypothetical protein